LTWVVFLREFKEFFGGHLKVWQYFQHFLDLGHDPVVQVTPDSLLDDSNPVARLRSRADHPGR
jgi:hypothetical protein